MVKLVKLTEGQPGSRLYGGVEPKTIGVILRERERERELKSKRERDSEI